MRFFDLVDSSSTVLQSPAKPRCVRVTTCDPILADTSIDDFFKQNKTSISVIVSADKKNYIKEFTCAEEFDIMSIFD